MTATNDCAGRARCIDSWRDEIVLAEKELWKREQSLAAHDMAEQHINVGATLASRDARREDVRERERLSADLRKNTRAWAEAWLRAALRVPSMFSKISAREEHRG